MNTCLFTWVGNLVQRCSHVATTSRPITFFSSAVLALLVSGCSVFWVANYDKEAVDRTTEISKSVLKLYQDLIAIELGKRSAAVAGSLGARHGDIDSQIRLHLLREQARAKNSDSTRVAGNLLESWQEFTVNHRSPDPSALSDDVLIIERMVLERHLRAAFIAEEAKRLGGGATT